MILLVNVSDATIFRFPETVIPSGHGKKPHSKMEVQRKKVKEISYYIELFIIFFMKLFYLN